MAKKKFFAQMADCTPGIHRAKCFDDLEVARCWLAESGGGNIKKRGAVINTHTIDCAIWDSDWDNDDVWNSDEDCNCGGLGSYFDKLAWSVLEEVQATDGDR